MLMSGIDVNTLVFVTAQNIYIYDPIYGLKNLYDFLHKLETSTVSPSNYWHPSLTLSPHVFPMELKLKNFCGH